MTPSPKHNRRIRQEQPVPVIPLQAVHQLPDEGVAPAGHHEADGEARGVGGGRGELEAAERAERALALQVHVEDCACVGGGGLLGWVVGDNRGIRGRGWL